MGHYLTSSKGFWTQVLVNSVLSRSILKWPGNGIPKFHINFSMHGMSGHKRKINIKSRYFFLFILCKMKFSFIIYQQHKRNKKCTCMCTCDHANYHITLELQYRLGNWQRLPALPDPTPHDQTNPCFPIHV